MSHAQFAADNNHTQTMRKPEMIYALTDLIDRDLDEEKLSVTEKQKLANRIKPLLSKDAIVHAQANPISGDIKYNALKAKNRIDWAEMLGISAVVFPENFLTGAPLSDYLLKFPIVLEECREWIEVLAKQTVKTRVIIGFVEKSANKLYNSIAVLCEGKIEKIIRKSVLIDADTSYESRYFSSEPFNIQDRIININDKKVLILIGEEISLIKESQNVDYIINCSSSIDRTEKEAYINNLLSGIAKNLNTPILYANQVGASDCVSYEGASRVYNRSGELIYRAKQYEEQFFIVDPFVTEGKIYPLPKGLEETLNSKKEFTLDYEPDLERTYKTIIQSIRDYFKKNGFKRACLGLSGGLDSTVCAVLLADAIGKENVFGISMPSKITSTQSKSDGKCLAENLGINYLEAPIKDMFDATRKTFDVLFPDMEKNWDCRYKESYTNDNIQARARAMILWGIANEFDRCLTIATSDKSEAYMGYATINGDMSGGYAPIADVTKTKLFALAKWLNKNREQKNAIPDSVINKRPGAELAINPKTGKPLLAEEALMPYEFLDEVIWRVENLNQAFNELLDSTFLYEKENLLSKEQKTEWLEKFFRRMSTAAYKGSIMPPAPIVDVHSINKAEFHQLITSSINYKKTSLDEKSRLFHA